MTISAARHGQLQRIPLHWAHGAGHGTGSTSTVTSLHVEQFHLRWRIDLAPHDLIERAKFLDHFLFDHGYM